MSDNEKDRGSGKDDDETIFISQDMAYRNPDAVLDEEDRGLVKAARSRKGTFSIGKTSDGHQLIVTPLVMREVAAFMRRRDLPDVMEKRMARKQAAYVRKLRVESLYSWRSVARACYEAWGGDWEPPSSQPVGMIICETAAAEFLEDYMKPPWN